ncbi:MAG: response regulator, partial [Betaproteobacteria bacterium]|nr:response regulator [Betaproteobacteria bacterium]
RRQLTVLAASGVIVLTLTAALLTAWQSSRQIRATQLELGIRVAQGLAAQSRLALLVSAQENVAEAVASALAFPDVVEVELWQSDGHLLVRRTKDGAAPGESAPPALTTDSGLESETAAVWRFVAPVEAGSEADSPFQASGEGPQRLGVVRIAQSKATLTRLMAEVFMVNLGVGAACAVVFLFLLRLLSRHLTRPLADLAETMERAEKGETGLRARLEGPRDLYHMAHAFNSMLEALEERERELRTARDSALRFARLKAEFAATLSHEIRTPLNGVIGTLDMLKAGAMGVRERELLELAWDSGQYLLELINNILDFSKLEAGKLEPERTRFDLAKLVRNTVNLFVPQAEAQNLALEFSLADGVPEAVLSDPARLRQILSNLIGNALKFTSSGRVSVQVEPAAPGSLTFTVVDTGIGINADDQARIFDSFTQADPSTTRRFGGSGLGLAICKQLVRALGGEIGVESTPGKGSRFHFTLPCPAAPELEVPTASPEPAATRPAPRILVVEDNRTNQIVAEGMLKMLGCRCRIAGNGREALIAWQDGLWDLILMDCAMPEMDGFEATARIRDTEGELARVPIVAMTANNQESDIEKCLAAGMDGHLPKPLTLEALAECLGRRLDWHARIAEPDASGDHTAAPLDPAIFARLREALGAAMADAIRPFVEDMPVYVTRLERAIATGDAAVIRQTAHAIKGAAGNLGAVHLAAVAREMETHAEAGSLAVAGDLLIGLRTEYALVEPLLSAELELPATPEAPFRSDDAPLVLIVDDDRS